MSIQSPFHREDRDELREGHRTSLHKRRAAREEAFVTNPVQVANNATFAVADEVLDQSPRVPVPLATLVGAHLFGGSLDDRLAKGESPASSLLLATRAQLIVSPARRRALAENWLSLLTKARHPTPFRSPEVRFALERRVEPDLLRHERCEPRLTASRGDRATQPVGFVKAGEVRPTLLGDGGTLSRSQQRPSPWPL
ncbi:MAG: hypothetical protein ABR963_08870 [Acidimicrobiales bacterium]